MSRTLLTRLHKFEIGVYNTFMAEEATQLSFPETDSSLPEEHFVPSKKPDQPSPQVVAYEKMKAKKLISIPIETPIRNNPVGMPITVVNYALEGATARVRDTTTIRGDKSLWVEFESPPEMYGDMGWVTQRDRNDIKNGFR